MYHILQMPPFLLLFIIFILFGSIGIAGVYLFRKYVRLKYRRAHNEAVGFTFAILGGFYGLLLGFVVFFVWDSMKEAHNNADREGSLAKGLYRNIRYYCDNDQAQRPLMNSYLKYVNYVLDKEYPDMEHLRPQSDSGRLYFNDVYYKMEQLKGDNVRMNGMFNQLNELATYRSLRQLDGDSAMTIEIWVPILIGAFILLLSALLIEMESMHLHMTITAMLGVFIGMVMYIIILLDHPFTGTIRIEPTGFRDVIRMTHDIDK